jgi:hypothetical protein
MYSGKVYFKHLCILRGIERQRNECSIFILQYLVVHDCLYKHRGGAPRTAAARGENSFGTQHRPG